MDVNCPLGQPRECRANKEEVQGEEVNCAFQEMPREGKKRNSAWSSNRVKETVFQGEKACDGRRRERRSEEKGETKKPAEGMSFRACIL